MSLCRLYQKHGIKRKVIRKKKVLPFGGEEEHEKQLKEARDGLQEHFKLGSKIVYLDEVFFTRTVNQTRDYCNTHSSYFVD